MKAIRVDGFGGVEVLKMHDLPVPVPGSRQVLIRTQAIGVNPVDTYWRAGLNPNLTLPFTPGIDASGTVESVGEGIRDLTPGTRVYLGGSISGTYAEFVLAKENQVHRLPTKTPFAEGAALHVPYATAYRALFDRGQARKGDILLIHGASGGVGLAAIQFARTAGLTIIGTAGSERGRQLLSEQRVHHILDHHAPNYLQAIVEITQGHGVDVILEMLANVNLGKVLPLLAQGGRVVVIGSRGTVEITPRDLMTRDADVRGMQLFNVPENDLQTIHTAIRAGLENDTLCPIIDRTFRLEDAAQAHIAVMEPGARGKIILSPRP